ncbi:MAG: imidazole glycerol phosphate synthase subunit HisF [Desulfamplus sp.]|nr:imidazole glycerol phosphate synthase subunit HisF [Desulfamplus sp.]
MLKKRIIFTLLYDSGHFMLSRNFRLQKVGNLQWLQKNYNFSSISFFIDELIVLDVSRGNRNIGAFCDTLKALTQGCFVPIAAGGGIKNVDDARQLLRSGADKVVVNTPLFIRLDLVKELTEAFGQQCVIGSIDLKKNREGHYQILIESGSKVLEKDTVDYLKGLRENIFGECYLNSIDQDGTGQGYDFDMLDLLPDNWTAPTILAGGAGNASHLIAGLNNPKVDAVATAHLFNFVGDGLKNARTKVSAASIELASWPSIETLLADMPESEKKA